MSENLWHITSHIIPASYPRGFSRGVRDEVNGRLRLAVKEYRSQGRVSTAGDATLIVAHGVGGCKEHFEPFLDDLLAQDLPVRAIWAFDAAHHGESYILNENVIGDEHDWNDNARDLLQIVNYFQSQISPPIFGIGSSWGASALWVSSSWHSNLFAGIIAVEGPSFTTAKGFKKHANSKPRKDIEHAGVLISKRRETWPTRDDARSRLSASPFFASYDPRVFEKHVQYCLRDAPTSKHPQAVRLTTPKSMEAAVFLQPDPPLVGHPEHGGRDNFTCVHGFHQPGVDDIVTATPQIQPPVLFVLGSESEIGTSTAFSDFIDMTGSGTNGNGGIKNGKVQKSIVEGSGHSVLLEKPRESAAQIGHWLRKAIDKWSEEKEKRVGQASFEPAILKREWTGRISKL